MDPPLDRQPQRLEPARARVHNNRAILKLAANKRLSSVENALRKWKGELKSGVSVTSLVTDTKVCVSLAKIERYYAKEE